MTTFLCLATWGSVAAVAAPAHETAAAAAAAGNPLWAMPIEALDATRDRPLFSPTRRPPPPVLAAAAVEPARAPPIEPERPPLLLIGTVAGDATAIAVFLDQTTKGTVRLLSGQSQYGWVLGAVHRREVVLQKDGAVVSLALSAAAAAPPPAAAPTQVAESKYERRER